VDIRVGHKEIEKQRKQNVVNLKYMRWSCIAECHTRKNNWHWHWHWHWIIQHNTRGMHTPDVLTCCSAAASTK
jgi:hypothetical protein